jgi:DNA-directed RNA polymerase specialized sigma24 family protein/CheY-like chemotaxis protein
MGLIVPELSHRLRASFGDNIRHFSDENGWHNSTAVPRRIFPLLTAQRQSNLLRQVEVLQENRLAITLCAPLAYVSSVSPRVHYRRQPAAAPLERMRMTTSQPVVQHVPYLRRYARVLTGNQASGDSYVAATLEALVNEPNLLALAEDPRIALYQVFSRIWNSVAVNEDAEPAINLLPVERHLGHITAMPRQALLLVSVEGFSEEDAAAILDVDQRKLQDLVDESGRELAVQIATDVLIIEDEMVIALDLERLVEDLGHRTIGIARTRAEAIKLSRVRRPGLILADIQLADGSSGLEAVNDLLNSFEVPVIFISAHPERFLTGERPEPAFLISKPYQQSTVSAVVSQALFFERNGRQPEKRAIE